MTYLPPRCPCGELLYDIWEEHNYTQTWDDEAGCYTGKDGPDCVICPNCRKEIFLDEFVDGVDDYLAAEWGEQPIPGT